MGNQSNLVVLQDTSMISFFIWHHIKASHSSPGINIIQRLKKWIWNQESGNGCIKRIILFIQGRLPISKLQYFIYIVRIFCYSTASTETAAYFIGGEDVGGQYLSTIAEFKDDEWRRVGDLVKARSSPSAISIGDETVIMGGYALGAR